MSKVMVTGVNGFVGKHVVNELARRGCEVIGVGLKGSAHPEIENKLSSFVACDLTDKSSVATLPVKDLAAVVSLAGLASMGQSFEKPDLYARVNVEVLTNVCNFLAAQKIETRVVAVSSGAVYDSHQPMPLTEQAELITQGSPYALSKIAMEKAVEELRNGGLDCVVVRPFNHFGPGQESGFLIPDLYKKITQAKASGSPVSMSPKVTKRDFTDVHDIARAYADLALAEKLEHTIYNVCSGASRSTQEVLDALLQATGLEGKVEIKEDPSLLRPNDPEDLYGSFDRLHQETGWQPTIAFEQTIADFVTAQKV